MFTFPGCTPCCSGQSHSERDLGIWAEWLSGSSTRQCHLRGRSGLGRGPQIVWSFLLMATLLSVFGPFYTSLNEDKHSVTAADSCHCKAQQCLPHPDGGAHNLVTSALESQEACYLPCSPEQLFEYWAPSLPTAHEFLLQPRFLQTHDVLHGI